MHLCLTVAGTVIRRGERLLRRHLGEVTKPNRGEAVYSFFKVLMHD